MTKNDLLEFIKDLSEKESLNEKYYEGLELLYRIVNDVDLKDLSSIRVCSECGSIMTSGYCVDDGEEYYCSDDCLHKHYTPDEWDTMYSDDGDTYWTEWEV